MVTFTSGLCEAPPLTVTPVQVTLLLHETSGHVTQPLLSPSSPSPECSDIEAGSLMTPNKKGFIPYHLGQL